MIGISIANDAEVGVFESLDALGVYLEPWYFSEEGGRVFDEEGHEYNVILGRRDSLKFEKKADGAKHEQLLVERITYRAKLGEPASLPEALARYVEKYGYGCT